MGGFLSYIQPKWIDNRVYIMNSAALSVVAFLFCGPSEVFNFTNNIYMIAFGCALSGPAISQFIVLALPEMMKQANLAFPNQEDRVSSYCSGMFNSVLGIGQIIGPLFGSYAYEMSGYRKS